MENRRYKCNIKAKNTDRKDGILPLMVHIYILSLNISKMVRSPGFTWEHLYASLVYLDEKLEELLENCSEKT